ncbi:MAG: bifunctional 4-hydroxy-2-oxoglutarate aldolase/2-dehydro-3-deoxy-phosphogluconate aldolase [Novosphingobium sp.]|nr:bifunctional 4-hydroxy-2-oxoglutarate aldolase/2-dehydro-3-deoxy-phosphogluconate aldolase [Novosphingobium sp.]MCP5401470.1 bifunctional 4-hydroxy-2-oxoglutarate aldolase/2-dehydro-3-deoxy-phosphogluconate aldolase [Novosphingobium sp.]
MSDIEGIMRLGPVIPALVIEDVSHALPIAQALVAGGITALEVTLRTPCAIEAMREMKQVDGAVVGAGTVLNPADLDASLEAGAEFIVSPGLTEPLGKAAVASGVPFLPGTANAGDIMRGLDLGLNRFKFFPAQASGGISALKAIAAAFGGVRFCPTGGINQDSAPEWLALDQVICVGGSWLVPKGPPDPARIEEAARAAAALAQ